MTTLDDELQDAVERGELEPNNPSATLADYVEIVRGSRERTAGVFPLPDVDSCIDYAITEAGEYLDAILRDKRNGDKRNNDKAHNARNEWGQAGYMICSAIIQQNTAHLDRFDWNPFIMAAEGNLHVVIARLCDIRTGLAYGDPPTVDALDQWNAYAERCGYNPADLLRETCAAFEAKHLQVA